MMTIHDKEGFHYELFPINGCPAEGSQMDSVLIRIGKESSVKRIVPQDLGLYGWRFCFQIAKGSLYNI